jgi:ubiquinone/menaquinone biosynthesis C-methylase UbiE
MKFDTYSYLKAFDHNYRVAYAEGLTYFGEGASQKKALQRLKRLLQKTDLFPQGTKLLDLGCGDGTHGLFFTGLGYHYTGLDISEAAIERACQRTAEAGLEVDFRVGDVLDLREFQTGEFPIILDSYCFHMLVLDTHRATYFQNVKRILQENGFLILLAQRDETAYEGPISSFEEFCQLGAANPSGSPFQKCVDGHWGEVTGQTVFLLGRARSLKGYQEEVTNAGFRIVHQSTWDHRRKVAFVLKKT